MHVFPNPVIYTGINHLHTRTKEFINMLVVVMPQLDTVVTSMNVLNPLDDVSHSNICCDLNIQYVLIS